MADPPAEPQTTLDTIPADAPSPATWTAVAALWGRAVEQTRETPLIRDPAAAAWLDKLDLDTSRLTRAAATQVAVCARARLIDDWVTAWASEQDGDVGGVVIELGIGFSTRALRLANLNLDFVGVDQADAAGRRDPLAFANGLAPTRVADVTEAACIDHLAVAAASGPTCIVAEGLFMYLEPAQVHTLLARLAAAFPDSTLLFDAYAPPARHLQHFHDSLGPLAVKLRSTWTGSPRVQVFETRTLRDDPAAWRRLPWVYRLPGVHRLHATHRAELTPPKSARWSRPARPWLR